MAYTYDSAGNLATEARTFTGASGTFTTTYGYDAEGKLTSIIYPSGRLVAVGYRDNGAYTAGRLYAVADNTTSTLVLGSVSDNAAGQITSQAFGAASGTTTVARSFNSRSNSREPQLPSAARPYWNWITVMEIPIMERSDPGWTVCSPNTRSTIATMPCSG